MTDVKTFKYRTNLARKMSSPGGRSVSEVLVKADAGLAQHRSAAMATLAERVVALEEACATRAPGSESEIYDRAAAVLDMAGFFETGPLYKAAFSLCELSDRMIEGEVWNWPSIAVHVGALRLILADDCQESEQATRVLEGLSTILGRYSTRPH